MSGKPIYKEAMLIPSAADFAQRHHVRQVRKFNNGPYILHPCRVAGRFAIHKLATDESIAAAFLHDTLEDCQPAVTPGLLRSCFGDEVLRIVEGLTNVKVEGLERGFQKLRDRNRLSKQDMTIRVIKLIDRIDNLGELLQDAQSYAKAAVFLPRYAQESRLLLIAIGSADEDLAAELDRLVDQSMMFKQEWNHDDRCQ